jgi:outer membrane biosynthesis protein TonB
MIEISRKALELIVIGLIILVVILLIILFICCCKYFNKSSNTVSREIKFTDGINKSNDQVRKSFNFSDDNNNLNNLNAFKSLYSQTSDKSTTLNSYTSRSKQNSNENIDVPTATYYPSTTNRSMMENVDQESLNRSYLSNNISINNSNYVTYDIGNPSLQRISYSSTNATNDSQLMPPVKSLVNYSYTEINDVRRNRGQNVLERKQYMMSPTLTSNGRVATPSVLSSKASSSIIASPQPGNMGRNSNIKNIPMTNDNYSQLNLHENSFQSNRSHVSYTNSTPQERGYFNSNIYQKLPMSKSFNIENIHSSHLSPRQQNAALNIGNIHVGKSFSIEDLETMHHYNMEEVDSIVDNAESILDALSHHSFSSSNNQSVNLLGGNINKPNTGLRNSMISNNMGNISNVAVKARSSLDLQDTSFTSSQNPVDAIVGNMNSELIQRSRNRSHSNSQNNNFQKTIPLQVQPSMNTYLSEIPEGQVINNSRHKSESVIDQSNYESSFSESTIKASRLYPNAKNNYENDGYRNVNIIPAELKNHDSSFYIDEDETTSPKQSRYVHLRDQIRLESEADINDLSKVKIQRLYDPENGNNNSNILGPLSPTNAFMNLNLNNGGFLNYKKEQLKENFIHRRNKNRNRTNNYNIAVSDYNQAKVKRSYISLNSQDGDGHDYGNDNDNGNNISFDQNSILKSPSSFVINSPISQITPIKSNENLLRTNRLKETTQGISSDKNVIYGHQVENNNSYAHESTFDDDNNLINSSIVGTIGRSTLDHSFVRNNNTNHTIGNLSHMSRNGYHPSITKSNTSFMSHNEDDDNSIYAEGQSLISFENINIPKVKHTHRLTNIEEKIPEIHKVEVNYSINNLGETYDVNDEIEKDVFMRPSMVRYVEIEPSPVLQQEAETTCILYVSSSNSSSDQSSISQNILDDLNNNINEEEKEVEKKEEKDDEIKDDKEKKEEEKKDENEEEKEKKNEDEEEKKNENENENEEKEKEDDDEEETAKNERLESPMTIVTMASPSSSNNEIIIKNDDLLKEIKNRDSNSSCIELLKHNSNNDDDEDFSSPTLTLHESSVNNVINLENNNGESKLKVIEA